MSYSSDAVDQVVRIALKGTEIVLRLAGKGAREIAALIGSLFSDDRKTGGKVRIANMLRRGKELRVFAVRDSDLRSFCAEAKRYGIQYTVVKDRTADYGITDILVRREDAPMVNRIFRNMGSVKTIPVSERSLPDQHEKDTTLEIMTETGKRVMTQQEKTEAFLRDVIKGEAEETKDPTEVRTEMTDPSGLFSEGRPLSGGIWIGSDRRSVRKQLADIRNNARRNRRGADINLDPGISGRYSMTEEI